MKTDVAVLVCSDAEWEIVVGFYPKAKSEKSPFGEYFEERSLPGDTVFFHCGFGKIAAAASAQFLIDRFSPKLLINLGTCGGFEGEVEVGQILLAERTVVYDIVERMLDPDASISTYTTRIDLTFIEEPFPFSVQRAILVSADRDLVPEEIAGLRDKYLAVAGDWESGAVAYVASKNQTPCLILRGVTDLTGSVGGEADGNYDLFIRRTGPIMKKFLDSLGSWIENVKVF